MMGLLLWYNPETEVGLIWCEDQGPLAVLGADVPLPEGAGPLHCGDQLRFSLEMRDGLRCVRDVIDCAAATGKTAPHEIMADFHRARDAERRLRVVA